MQGVAAELFGERHEFARVLATRGPVDQSLILLELKDLAEPEGAGFVRDGDHVGNIAGPEAAADAQLDVFEKSSRAPFFLKPLHRDGRAAIFRIATAATLADGKMPDDNALGREVGIVHGLELDEG